MFTTNLSITLFKLVSLAIEENRKVQALLALVHVDEAKDLLDYLKTTKTFPASVEMQETITQLFNEADRYLYLLKEPRRKQEPAQCPGCRELELERERIEAENQDITRKERQKTIDLLRAQAIAAEQMVLSAGCEIPQIIELPSADGLLETKLATRLSNCCLSHRAYTATVKSNILTIGDLIVKTDAEILKTKNLGRKTLRELRVFLADQNLRFGSIIVNHDD